MIIKTLYAKTYRNIKEAKIDFSPSVNLLIGKNAQGKTNIIEAIYTFARGKSFRSANDKKLTMIGCEGYDIGIEFEDKKREKTLSYSYKNGEKIKKKNGIEEDKAVDMLGAFRAVLFCPEHLMIVKGAPSERREFLNIAISQNDTLYLKTYSLYNKVLENRNSLIREAQKGHPVNAAEINVFSSQLATYSAVLYMKRKEYIERLEKYAKKAMADISKNTEELSIEYESDVVSNTEKDAREKYCILLSENLTKEIQNGSTSFGIHRDDIDIKINGISSRVFASQGQQRSVALSLKIAECEVSRDLNGEYPVLLFDDVLSELDEERQKYIISGIEGKQIIISACDPNIFDKDKVNIIEVEAGNYVSSYRQR